MAVRSSLLYFAIASLSEVETMYQYSLDYFWKLFDNCILSSEQSSDLAIRLNTLITNITKAAYCSVARGLFEKDKVLFAFMICSRILTNKGEITMDEWDLLLRGPTGELLNKVQGEEDDIPPMLKALSVASPSFNEFLTSYQVDRALWNQWAASAETRIHEFARQESRRFSFTLVQIRNLCQHLGTRDSVLSTSFC